MMGDVFFSLGVGRASSRISAGSSYNKLDIREKLEVSQVT